MARWTQSSIALKWLPQTLCNWSPHYTASSSGNLPHLDSSPPPAAAVRFPHTSDSQVILRLPRPPVSCLSFPCRITSSKCAGRKVRWQRDLYSSTPHETRLAFLKTISSRDLLRTRKRVHAGGSIYNGRVTRCSRHAVRLCDVAWNATLPVCNDFSSSKTGRGRRA